MVEDHQRYVVFLISDSTGFVFIDSVVPADAAGHRHGVSRSLAMNRLFDHVDIVSTSLGRVGRCSSRGGLAPS